MKRRDRLKEIRELPVPDLKARAKGSAEELMKLRFRKASGQLEHSHRIGQLSRDLARTLTVLRAARSE